jgi:hypothetical protein
MAESEPARSHDVPLGVSELSNARDPDVAPAEDKMAADDHADALSQDTQAIEPVIALTAPGQSNQAIPQQKKFTSSNINKKFLEKTGSGPAPAASQTAAAKPGTPTRVFMYIIRDLITLLITTIASETGPGLECFPLSSRHYSAHDQPAICGCRRPRLAASLFYNANNCTCYCCQHAATESNFGCTTTSCCCKGNPSCTHSAWLPRWQVGVASHSSPSSADEQSGGLGVSDCWASARSVHCDFFR